MINGPFGVGKTSVSRILEQNLKNFIIYDPEEIGFMLSKIIPSRLLNDYEKTDDFQDITLWRIVSSDVAERIINIYGTNLIIPMTIYNVDYFNYILDRLKATDPMVYHFCLLADKHTIKKRLESRNDQDGSWPHLQIEKCLKSFNQNKEVFETIIDTSKLTADCVSRIILDRINCINQI